MDITYEGIHYIGMLEHVPDHIHRCHSRETARHIAWKIAKVAGKNPITIENITQQSVEIIKSIYLKK